MSKYLTSKRMLKTTAWLGTSILFTLIFIFILHRPSLDVVYQWQQPSSIHYDDWGPYYLSVVEDDMDWSSFPIYVERNYFVYVGRDSGKPSYGHMIKFSFHPHTDDLATFLSKAKVDWTEQGVDLELPSEHRLFVPKDMFKGGR